MKLTPHIKIAYANAVSIRTGTEVAPAVSWNYLYSLNVPQQNLTYKLISESKLFLDPR